MPIRGHIQYARPPEGTRKELTAAAAAGNEAAVEYWHRHFRPEHFTVSGGRKYRYQPRQGDNEPPRVLVSKGTLANRYRANPAYSWRKRREKGHNKPLVWSGRSRDASQAVRVTSTSRSGTGTYVALPKYFYAYRKDLKQPDKVAEFLKVLPEEATAMAMAAQAAMVGHLNAIRGFAGGVAA